MTDQCTESGSLRLHMHASARSCSLRGVCTLLALFLLLSEWGGFCVVVRSIQRAGCWGRIIFGGQFCPGREKSRGSANSAFIIHGISIRLLLHVGIHIALSRSVQTQKREQEDNQSTEPARCSQYRALFVYTRRILHSTSSYSLSFQK